MIKLFRWHHDHYQMTPIDNMDQVVEISLVYDERGNHVPLQKDQLVNTNNFRKTVDFLIGYHTTQRNIYLVLSNARMNNEFVLAELKKHYDMDMSITVNPGKLNRLSHFGEAIAAGLSDMAKIIVAVEDDNFVVEVKFGEFWEDEIKLPIPELTHFIDMDFAPIAVDEVEATDDYEPDPETEMTAETEVEGSEEKEPISEDPDEEK